MRSRFFHRPLLHSPALGLEKKATWLELFYDLIFVAAFIQLGNGLSAHVSLGGVFTFVGVFVPLWVAWTGFTFYENRYNVDDFTHRLFVFVQMFAVGGMAISAPLVLSGATFAFSLAAGVAQLMVAVMYLRAYAQMTEARDYSRYWGLVFAVSGALWLGSAFLPPAFAYPAWALASVAVLGSPLSRQSRSLAERYPLDFEHLGERYALLTIIVLGESFVKVLGSLAAETAGLSLYLEAGVALVITCAIWWVYFDDVAGAHIRKGPGQWIVWLYSHLPLQVAIVATGVAVKKAVHFSWDEPAGLAYRWLLSGSVALVCFSVAAIDSVTERRQAELSDRARVNARAVSGLVLLALAPAGGGMTGGAFLLMVTGIIVAQVAFDLMMAPLEASEHSELGKQTTAELARMRERGEAPRQTRSDVGAAIRKGTPSDLRQDLYFYLIGGSWWRLFAFFSVLFLLVNVFFGALFAMHPGAIAGARLSSFADAFFFSVQTMSTIGYGALSPGDDYANVIVAVEAAVGMVAVAVATGLVFAKLSRPSAGVLFSESMVLTTMDGKPTLMFRMGNTRGNEVVDASVRLTALIDELSAEGHHLRRLHDLELVRSTSPMFMLSWSVMHVVDEDSPLWGTNWQAPEGRILALIATLMGHDGTYAQTTYARHVYYCDDLRVGERFVDIVSELEDGRMMIDYERFHDTAPDVAAG